MASFRQLPKGANFFIAFEGFILKNGYPRTIGQFMKRLFLYGSFAIATAVLLAAGAHAQDLEPRSYANTPVGLNFLLAGYGYSEGKMAFDPSLSTIDGQFRSNTELLAYARALDVFGMSAKIDMIVPYSSFSGHALVNGQAIEREMSGFNDPRFRFSMNFYGAPALSLKEFASYHQDLIIGASLQVSPPLGQYDETKLINLGNNWWSFKPEIGISKAWGPWTLEIVPSATFYTENTDFFFGGRLSQAPVYAVQGHILYNFQSGIWASLDGTFFTGGRTTINGVRSNNEQTSTRAGFTLALPVDRYNSLKLYASTGTSTRTGSEFKVIGIAWQYRWGGGY